MEQITCLVTRPAHQNQTLNKILLQAGFRIINFPTIAINAASATAILKALPDYIQQFNVALFVSRNAVDFSFKYLDAAALPSSLQLGVIGKGTCQALKKHGLESHIISADNYNSEGLLASKLLLQVKGKRVLILRGQQGRNLLGDTLRERGADVEYCEVYRRALPEYTPDYFEKLSKDYFPDIAIFTSAEGLNNGLQLLDEVQADRLRCIPWLLISERMRETARDLRHNADIIIAHSASDEGIVQALVEWQIS